METLDYSEYEFSGQTPLKDNSKRANYAIYVLYGIIILNILTMISLFFLYNLLSEVNNGWNYTLEELKMAFIRTGILALLKTILFIISAVLFLNWFRRAHANLHRADTEGLKFEHETAVWGFIIPILNLFRPVQIMKEIWFKTQEKIQELKEDYKPDYSLVLVGIWWAFFLFSRFFSSYVSFDANWMNSKIQIEEQLENTYYTFISFALEIISAFITIKLIKKVSQKENILYQEILKSPDYEDPEMREEY